MALPIVYTLTSCPTCDDLRTDWRTKRIQYEERRVDTSQQWLNEALRYADTVPIVVRPDGAVELGFEGEMG
jgi:glutaredoxin-related protein